MPMLGDIFINNVKAEQYDEAVETTDHPIEGGKEITDHIERKPIILKIHGVITGPDAAAKLSKIRGYMNSGEMLKYTYRSSITNVVIEKFPHDHITEVANGFQFQLSLKQIRIAKAGAVRTGRPIKTNPQSNKGRQQPSGSTPVKSYTVKAGDTLSEIGADQGVSWQKIYDKNRGVIGNDPDRIYPGQKIIIPA